jgi:type I restriction enzyme, S subunit
MKSRVYTKPFGDLAEFRNGVNFSADSRGAGDLAVIGVGDFKAKERLTDFTHLERIERPTGLDDDALLRNGDLVFVRSNGNKQLIGRCMILAGIKGPVSHSGFTIRARVTTNEVSPEWIGQYFATGLAKRDIMRRGGGSNISNLSQQILQDLPIPVADSKCQQLVLNATEQFSQRLRLLDEALARRNDLKRGLMTELLTGRKRFPAFTSRQWRLSRLGDHVEQRSRRNSTGATLVLTASGEHGLVDQRRYFNRSVAAADLSRYWLLKKGEFAYNRSAMKGYPYGATKRLDAHAEGVLSTLYLCFAINDDQLDSDFLKHVLESGVLNRQLRPIVRIGARAHGLLNVSDEDYLSISIPFPKLDEQRRIASLLNDIDREIYLIEAQRAQTAIYKRGLFSRLLSGEIVVP